MDRRGRLLIIFDRYGWRYAPGKYKHCFSWVFVDDVWVRYEIIYGNLEVETIKGLSEKEMIKWHEDRGYAVVKASIGKKKSRLFMLNTCVGHIKNLLGITYPFILTPQQLYNYLQKGNQHGRFYKLPQATGTTSPAPSNSDEGGSGSRGVKGEA